MLVLVALDDATEIVAPYICACSGFSPLSGGKCSNLAEVAEVDLDVDTVTDALVKAGYDDEDNAMALLARIADFDEGAWVWLTGGEVQEWVDPIDPPGDDDGGVFA